jgi:hypothetical protein
MRTACVRRPLRVPKRGLRLRNCFVRNHLLLVGTNVFKRLLYEYDMPISHGPLWNYMLRSGPDVLRNYLLPYWVDMFKWCLFQHLRRLRDSQRGRIFILRRLRSNRQLLPTRQLLFGSHQGGVLPS